MQVILWLLHKRLVSLISEKGKMGKALSVLKNEMVGSYCFTFISDDNSVYAASDPKGFRPMVLGHKESDDTYIVASESSALSAVGAKIATRCCSRRINPS